MLKIVFRSVLYVISVNQLKIQISSKIWFNFCWISYSFVLLLACVEWKSPIFIVYLHTMLCYRSERKVYSPVWLNRVSLQEFWLLECYLNKKGFWNLFLVWATLAHDCLIFNTLLVITEFKLLYRIFQVVTMTSSLLIRGGHVVNDDAIFQADVAVENGIITWVSKNCGVGFNKLLN